MKSITPRTPLARTLEIQGRMTVKVCSDGHKRNTIQPLSDEESVSRFMAKVNKSPTGCWIWTGAICGRGIPYGHLARNGRHIKAHRFSYEIWSGRKLLPHEIAMHTCDNGLCVNPQHIRIGTTQENVDDKMQKGRHGYGVLRGEKNSRSVITEEQVRNVLALSNATGSTYESISKLTGVSRSNVGAILQGRTWRHITGFKSPDC